MRVLTFLVLGIYFYGPHSGAAPTLVCDTAKHPTDELEIVSDTILCQTDFSEKEWDQITPLAGHLENGVIDRRQALRYLKRFAKPGGYDAKKHAGIFKTILDSDFRKEFQKEITFALQQVMLVHLEFYYEIQWDVKFKEILDFRTPPFSDEESCRSEKEKHESRQKIFEFAVDQTKFYNMETPSSVTDWRLIAPLIPSLRNLPTEKQNEIILPMARSLATGLVDGHPGLFISKALVFSKNWAHKIFGHEVPKVTDITAAKMKSYNAQGEITMDEKIIVLSTDPITSIEAPHPSQISPYEVYYPVHLRYVDPPDLKKGDIVPTDVSWTTAEKNYHSTVKLKRKSNKLQLPEGAAPNYEKMWQDKKLSGLIMVSDNLGGFVAKTNSHYLQYYKDQGFEFEQPIKITDSKNWVSEQISTGKVDYVMKEAHAGGNDSSLMTIKKEHNLVRGVRKLEKGKEEEVFLFLPAENSSYETQRLQFADMNAWMDTREKNKSGPLVYVNSSCWSMEQASNEIPAVDSKLFVNVASTTKTTTFFNGKNSTKYHILEGLRSGKSYKSMREGMATTTRHQKGYNQFYFPDQKEYIKKMQDGLDVFVKISDENGKPYFIDQ